MARVRKVCVTCVFFFFHTHTQKLEQKEIPASVFLLDHLLWEERGFKAAAQSSGSEGKR